jgi:hypothetical protein
MGKMGVVSDRCCRCLSKRKMGTDLGAARVTSPKFVVEGLHDPFPVCSMPVHITLLTVRPQFLWRKGTIPPFQLQLSVASHKDTHMFVPTYARGMQCKNSKYCLIVATTWHPGHPTASIKTRPVRDLEG